MFLPARRAAYVVAALAAVCLLLCMPLFDASSAWLRIGPRYGAAKYDHDLSVGNAFCLAAIFDARGWGAHDVVFRLPFGAAVTMRQLLFGLYAAMLVACSFAMARLWQRNDPRLLAAIALPWLAWFAFAAQIHERYLLFGAVVGGIAIAVHAGAFLVALLMTALSWIMTVGVMLDMPGRDRFLGGNGPELDRFIDGLHPAFCWVVMTATLAVLAMCLWPARAEQDSQVRRPLRCSRG